jgi:tetratricopeptide (TPR) repeat protein
VVRDEASGRLGAVTSRVDVPVPDAIQAPPPLPAPAEAGEADLAEPGPEAYRALLRRYRSGEGQAAVAALAGWPHHDSQEALLDDEADGTAAVLLHTEVGLAFLAELALRVDASQLWRTRSPFRDNVAYHLGIAERLLDRRSGRWSGGAGLHRAWLLAVGAQLQTFWQLDDARRYLERARDLNGGDPEVLLALGALHEMGSLFRVAFVRGPELNRHQAEEWMARRAEERYREALEAQPELAEGRLRLGRLLARRERNEEAERELLWVADHTQAPHLRSLAHLFLADLWQKTGRAQPALAHYQEAIRQAPHSRAAFVALTHALLGLGHHAAAREAAVLATRAGASGAQDPWLDYHFRAWATGPALAALRQRLLP